MTRLFEVPEDSLAAKKRDDSLWTRTVERVEDWKEALNERPTYRRLSTAAGRGYDWLRRAFDVGSRVAWVGATSALVLVVPLVYEIDRELEASSAGVGVALPASPASAGAQPSSPSSSTSSSPSSSQGATARQ